MSEKSTSNGGRKNLGKVSSAKAPSKSNHERLAHLMEDLSVDWGPFEIWVLNSGWVDLMVAGKVKFCCFAPMRTYTTHGKKGLWRPHRTLLILCEIDKLIRSKAGELHCERRLHTRSNDYALYIEKR